MIFPILIPVLIPKRKRLLGAGRFRCNESGTTSTMISVHDAAVGIAWVSFPKLIFTVIQHINNVDQKYNVSFDEKTVYFLQNIPAKSHRV